MARCMGLCFAFEWRGWGSLRVFFCREAVFLGGSVGEVLSYLAMALDRREPLEFWNSWTKCMES